MEKIQKKLSEIKATAICGNDISSSCLYVSALTILYAGQYAWIALIIVAIVLYLFRKIYAEVVGALPLNGGAYNALLNTTSKNVAAIAACLTSLSYMATAVISANEAMHYLHGIYDSVPVLAATFLILAVFLLITLMGISESASVAVIIFTIHILSLILLVSFSVYYFVTNGTEILSYNWSMPVREGSIITALFLGFSVAMLGISGFESSANYVEEQKPGVFPKTLRNMWIVVSIFNPAIAFLVLVILPASEVAGNKEQLLSHIGYVIGGPWLKWIIAMDAVLVLSGAVLTSFIGISGLFQRMTLDRILPQFLLKKNKKGASYWILIVFFLMCVSVLLVTKGQIESLAGVYTFSFLSVMVMFGAGNLLLKLKRNRLPRPVKAKPILVFLAIFMVLVAVVGNLTVNTESFWIFLRYFIPATILVFVMLNRTSLVKLVITLINYFYTPLRGFVIISNRKLSNAIHRINSQEFVFFTKADDVSILNKVMIYVTENESTKRLKVVNVLPPGGDNSLLKKDLEVLDRAYPDIDIEFIEIEGNFGPQLIEELSSKWNIPKNFMFIGSPGNKFPYRIEELGGVRLII